jgi:hypothetical protein
MPPVSPVQVNKYKGASPRCWLRLRFVAVDGSLHERELLADTGCPCAIIVGDTELTLLSRAGAAGTTSNFGPLTGAWLQLEMPELALTQHLVGYGSDQVLQAVQLDSPDFTGLVGLPFLRLTEYGGDGDQFWVSKPVVTP